MSTFKSPITGEPFSTESPFFAHLVQNGETVDSAKKIIENQKRNVKDETYLKG